MASKALSTSAFITELLAPPSQADTSGDKKFLRDLRADMKAAWRPAWLKVMSAKGYRDGANYLRISTRESGAPMDAVLSEYDDRHDAYLEAVDHLMLIPAPTMDDLRWKKTMREFAGGDPEWQAAIARDEALLARINAPHGVKGDA